MDILGALRRAYDQTAMVIAGISAEDYASPTPCTAWDVRALLNHLVNGIAMFPVILRGEQPDWSRDAIGPDPVAAFRAAVCENLAAWQQPGAVETPAHVLPGMRLIDLNLCDAVVHTWDLARATGQTVAWDQEVIGTVFRTWQKAPLDRSRQFGAFGPPVEVPDNAPLIDRLVGLLGRVP